MSTDEKPRIGFIGQGFLGKNYADDFEARGYPVVRYALEEPFRANLPQIAECGIVFVAVPTPTVPGATPGEVRFDDRIVRAAIADTAPGSVVVVRSTLAPGTTRTLQDAYPDRIVMHAPEFLREATAAHDAAHPERTIIGMSADTPEQRAAAERVRRVLPDAPYTRICSSIEAEYVKYANNAFLFMKVVFANIMRDAVVAEGGNWDVVSEALGADPRIGRSHLQVVHASGHRGAVAGRGASGHCLIKDFAALREHLAAVLREDPAGIAVFAALERKNNELLRASGKDIDLLEGVYGPEASRG